MNFQYRDDLKIEFRAVPYNTTHILEYRISPDQDLTFIKPIKLLFGLIKFNKKSKYSTKWRQPQVFCNYTLSYKLCKEDCYVPISILFKSTVQEYNEKYKTIGEFFKYIKEFSE